MRAFFGGHDVTEKLTRIEAPFVVGIDKLGDPTPGVYKFLTLIKDNQMVVIGEHDTINDFKTVFDNPPMCAHIAPLREFFFNKIGLEIAGESPQMIPTGLYTEPHQLDNVHLFKPQGLFTFPGKKAPGVTLRGDAVDLGFIAKNSYDFVFASHVLEHIKNPLKALVEMQRIVKPGGHCMLVLPFKDRTFDHRRPTTPFFELWQHYEDRTTEADVMDHVTPEMLALYDFDRDRPAGNQQQFIERCKNNFQNRALHIHVFDFELIRRCMTFAGFTPIYAQLSDIHQIVIGEKIPDASEEKKAPMMSAQSWKVVDDGMMERNCPWCGAAFWKDANCSFLYCGLGANGKFMKSFGCGRSWCFTCGKKYCALHYDPETGVQLPSYKAAHDVECCTKEQGFIQSEYCGGGHSSHCAKRW